MPHTALSSLYAAGLLAVCAISPAVTQDVWIDVPRDVPSNASSEVDPDFLGLAFEEAAWVRYATDDSGHTNIFTRNLMHSVYSRTGGKPIIRLGGTSADYAKYEPGQKEPALPVDEQNTFQDVGGTTIGPSYWSLAHRFPEGKFMVQVPLATTNISETVAWAKAAVELIGLEQIHSIQIGNEPNAYSENVRGAGGMFLGPPNYQGKLNNETYEGNYTEYASAIREAITLPDRFFTAFDIGEQVNTPFQSAWLFDVETVFGLGIDRDHIIKDVSHHYYQNVAGGAADLKDGLMTVANTHTQVDYLRRHIEYLKANHPDIPYILNEIGNSLDPTNSYEYQARLGSALWAVDFYLYCLSIGIARFNYQQIMHSGFDMWLPVASNGLPAQVFANYYAQPFLADFVGDSGSTRVAQLDVGNSEAAPNLAAYAAFEGGLAKRVAIANLDYWNRTSSDTPRPVATVRLRVPPEVKWVQVTHLSSPDGAGAAADTITYAGSQWTYESMGNEQKGVRNDTEGIAVRGEVAHVRVPSSEAVIVYLS